MLHSFGNNGEYAQMDSVYNLIIHEDHYKQDKLYALNITLDYARFLNQKGDSERANTLLTQIRDNAMALEKFPENTIAHQLQEIAAIATYEIAYGQWQNNQLPAARETAEEAVSQLEQVKDSVNLAEAYNLSGVIHRRCSCSTMPSHFIRRRSPLLKTCRITTWQPLSYPTFPFCTMKRARTMNHTDFS